MKSEPKPVLNDIRHIPEKIVLATDLSCRCDRALSRAIKISKDWNAHLTAVTVVDDQLATESHWEHLSTERRLERAEQHLRNDASIEGGFSIRVETGDVMEQLLRAVSESEAGLVVTGMARNQVLRSVLLGSVVDGLVRRSPVPVLMVRNPVWESYRRIVVAGDLSDLSLCLLKVALHYFPEAKIDFVHAFEAPYLVLADSDREIGIARARRVAQEEVLHFLKKMEFTPEQQNRIHVVCEHGTPVAVVYDFLLRSNADLVIIGNYRRNVLYEMLIGSTATQILQDTDSDVMVVPEWPANDQ